MKKIYLGIIIVLVTGLLIGCPSDPTGNGGGTTNPEKPVEQKPHIDYPDWNDNRVDDREEVLTPKDREELFSILDYQEEHQDKGWIAKKINVLNINLTGEFSDDPYDEEHYPFFYLGRSEYLGIDILDGKIQDWVTSFNQDISNWDVSKVTNMTYTFGSLFSFDQALSSWNVSNVTNMMGMFVGAISFNQDISQWDTSNVTNMYRMFADAASFNQSLGNWDVSKVTDMKGMFLWAESFNQDISQWNTSNVTDMSNMFEWAKSFNQPLGDWDVSNVTDMSFMFGVASSFNQPLAGWNTSNVTDMSEMFYGADSFNQDLGDWDVSKVTDMGAMFFWAESFNQDISQWDTSNVTDMSFMFVLAESFNQDLSSWDVTGKITTDMFDETPMEFKKDYHPQGCLCGARWDDPRNTEYRDTYGEWSHDPDNPIIN